MTSHVTGGSEIVVNSTIAGDQSGSCVTSLSNGGWAITFTGQDTDKTGVYTQNYDQLGNKLLDSDSQAAGNQDVLVNGDQTSYDEASEIVQAVNTPFGGTLLVYQRTEAGQGGYGIGLAAIDPTDPSKYIRLTDFVVNTTTTGPQTDPHIAMLSNGNFVITYTSPDGGNYEVWQQLCSLTVNVDGTVSVTKIGAEYHLNSFTSNYQDNTSVTALANGCWVATWSSGDIDGGGAYGVVQRVFGPNGQPFSDDIVVNNISTGAQASPVITTLADGSYVIAWTGVSQGGAPNGIYFQHCNFATGTMPDPQNPKLPNDVGPESRASQQTLSFLGPDNATHLDIAAMPDGGFVIVWSAAAIAGQGTTGTQEIWMQRYNALGEKVGDGNETLVNTNTAGDQYDPSVAVTSDGRIVVSWTSVDTDGSKGVVSRVFVSDVEGTTGNDDLHGTRWDEAIYGYAGNDTLTGAGGTDTLIGGLGNDTYVLAADDISDKIVENNGEGNDTVITSIENITLGQYLENLTLAAGVVKGTGNGDNNILTGNALNNSLLGMAGDDSLIGGLGADYMEGGDGNDTYSVDDTNDIVVEASTANAGTMDVVMSTANWTMSANVEKLVLLDVGDGANNNLTGIGNSGANILIGNSGSNTLRGMDGNDWLDGGLGNDILIGGNGNDTYIVESPLDQVSEDLANSNSTADLVISSITYTLGPYVENLTLASGAGNIHGFGNELSNILTGNEGNNSLSGGALNDTLVGNGGNDVLDGGTGADAMIGGDGDDIYYIDDAGDTITETSTGGTADTVRIASNFDMKDFLNIERMELLGTNNLNGIGNVNDNYLKGNSGNNNLQGLGGADVLDGNGGADILSGGEGNDTYIVEGGDDQIVGETGGTDEVQSYGSFTLANLSFIENLTLLGNGADTAIGNTLNNTITGNNNDNTLNGGGGDDVMIGLGGSDTYVVDSVNDTITESSLAGGFDTVQAWVSYALPDNVEKIQLMGIGDLNATGNGGENQLVGNVGNNVLDGGAGKDIMAGDDGDDVYIVRDTTDVVNEEANSGTDRVESSVTYTLSPNVENLVLTGVGLIDGTGNGMGNEITGNDQTNKLMGMDGNDTLNGMGGEDQLYGGEGNDTYIVQDVGDKVFEDDNAGDDTVRSTAISFTISNFVEKLILLDGALNGTGSATVNTIIGNDSDNVIDGGGGADILTGGKGSDTYRVDNTGDVINENDKEGTDTVESSAANYVVGNAFVENMTLIAGGISITANTGDNIMTGNEGDNSLYGMGGADTINADKGNDFLDGGDGDDIMRGGGGDDTYVVNSVNDRVIELSADDGNDTVKTSLANATVATYSFIENLVLTASGNQNGTGNNGANQLVGNDWANVLDGGGGDDILRGGAGKDTLIGGEGRNSLYGDAGDDIYVVTSSSDRIFETAANGGIDTVKSYVSSFAIGNSYVENLILRRAGNANGYGNSLANSITGNNYVNVIGGGAGNDRITGYGGADRLSGDDGQDRLYGGSGDDILSGGNGNDTLSGDAGRDRMAGGRGNDIYYAEAGDTITEAGNGGYDTVYAQTSFTLSNNVERLILSGRNKINGTGGATDNQLYGNSNSNRLNGGGGNDYLNGGAGKDNLNGGAGKDTLNGGAGNDTLNGGAKADRLDGGAGQDKLLGGADKDTLKGGAGNDWLWGGQGNDVLTGGAGRDTFVFKPKDGHDTIKDFRNGDHIDLSAYHAFHNFKYMQSHHMIKYAHGDAIITHGHDQLILDHVKKGSLDASDFHF